MKQSSNQIKTFSKRNNGKNDSRPEWVDTVSDLSIYKATPQDMERKKILSKSKHANAAKLEIQQKQKARNRKNLKVSDQDGEKKITPNPVLTSGFLFHANEISIIASPKERLEVIKGIWKNMSKSSGDLTPSAMLKIENRQQSWYKDKTILTTYPTCCSLNPQGNKNSKWKWCPQNQSSTLDVSGRKTQEDKQDIEQKEHYIKQLGHIVERLKSIDSNNAIISDFEEHIKKEVNDKIFRICEGIEKGKDVYCSLQAKHCEMPVFKGLPKTHKEKDEGKFTVYSIVESWASSLKKILNKLAEVLSELEEKAENVQIKYSSYLEIPKISNISEFSFCLLSILSRLIHILVQLSGEYAKQSRHNEELAQEISKQRLLIGELNTELYRMQMHHLENQTLKLQQYPKKSVKKIDVLPLSGHGKRSYNPIRSPNRTGKICSLKFFSEKKTCEVAEDKASEISENALSTSSGPGGDLNHCYWYNEQSGDNTNSERIAGTEEKLDHFKGRKYGEPTIISFHCNKSASLPEDSETVKDNSCIEDNSSLFRTLSEDNMAYHLKSQYAILLSNPKQYDAMKMSTAEPISENNTVISDILSGSSVKLVKTDSTTRMSPPFKTNLELESEFASLSTYNFPSESSVLIEKKALNSFAPKTLYTDHPSENSSCQTTAGNSDKTENCNDSQVQDRKAKHKLDMDLLFKKLEVLQNQCIIDNEKLQSLLDSKNNI